MPIRRSVFLIFAFAALFAVSALAAVAVWRNAREAQYQASDLHDRDLLSHAALADIRSNVYQTAVLTRDFVLDQNLEHMTDFEDQLANAGRQARGSLRILMQSAQNQSQKASLAVLEAELDAYLKTAQILIDSAHGAERLDQRSDLFRQRVHRRAEIFALMTQIEQVTAETSVQERERLAESQRYFRSSLSWIAGVALLLGLSIAAFTLARMQALERQSQSAEAELRRLSGEIRTAQEQERKSLSRELHDQVGQMLTGLRMELAALARANSSSSAHVIDPELGAAVERAKGTVEQTLGIVRNIAMLLRPSMLDDLGLTPALIWLAKELSRSSGVNIRTEIDPRVDRLPDAHRTCLYRVVQEALTNTLKHSGARSVDLRIATKGAWVQAVISDDGRGFEFDAEKRKGLGFLGMEERVRELGGHFRVTSEPGRGANVEIRLPQPANCEGEKDDQGIDRRRSRDRADRLKTAL
ncbi:MAG: ATP-binding protein [Acidobacteriota bacterium]